VVFEGLLIFLLIGLIAGWLAGQILRGSGYGLVGDLVVGVIGAMIGGWIFALLGIVAFGLLGSIIAATCGVRPRPARGRAEGGPRGYLAKRRQQPTRTSAKAATGRTRPTARRETNQTRNTSSTSSCRANHGAKFEVTPV
jgi:uncharacterized membrane protein YeaQ/YmgE (transglycosylase-associated protein family)